MSELVLYSQRRYQMTIGQRILNVSQISGIVHYLARAPIEVMSSLSIPICLSKRSTSIDGSSYFLKLLMSIL